MRLETWRSVTKKMLFDAPVGRHGSFGRTLIFRGDMSGRLILRNENLIVVTGAGGFIGGDLVGALLGAGLKRSRAVDVKPFEEWYQRFGDVENLSLDLNSKENCERAAKNACDIYNLA